MFVRRKRYDLFCILGPLGTFLVLTKIFTFWVVLWFVEVGMGDPPLKRKIPTLSRFVRFFYRMSTRGPKTKLT